MKFKIYYVLLFFCGILFITLYLILSWNNRLPYEDYTFTSLAKEKGFINAMIEVYNVYSARWSAHTMAFFFSRFYKNKFFLPVFNIITLLVLIATFFSLIRRILNEILNFTISNKILIAYTLLFTSCFFFSSYDIGQTWFWYMVNWMYMWSIIAGNFLIWILLAAKLKPIQIPLIIIITAYIAGAAESYAMIYIFLFGIILFLKRKNILPLFTNRIQNKTLVIFLILLVLFYMITLFAPGTWARKDMLTHASFIQHVIMTMKACGIIILKQTPKLIPFLILFGLPWMMIGKEVSPEEKIGIKKMILPFIKSFIIIGGLIFILILPASWILYDVPPARALSQISLLLSIYVSFVCFYIGYKIDISKKIIQIITLFALVLSVGFIFFQIVNQYSITSNFSSLYDTRIENLKKENKSGRNSVKILEPLPSSGILYSDKLSPDSLRNNCFEKVYGLNFHVISRINSETEEEKK